MTVKITRVFYVDVGNMTNMKAEQYIKDMIDKLKSNTEDYENFFLPIRGNGNESRVEVFNYANTENVEWEYLRHYDPSKDDLDRIGKEKWELVNFYCNSFVFKRSIKSNVKELKI